MLLNLYLLFSPRIYLRNGRHRDKLGTYPGEPSDTGLGRLRRKSEVGSIFTHIFRVKRHFFYEKIKLKLLNFLFLREMFDLLNVNEAKGLTIYEIENGIVDMTQTGDLFDRFEYL